MFRQPPTRGTCLTDHLVHSTLKEKKNPSTHPQASAAESNPDAKLVPLSIPSTSPLAPLVTSPFAPLSQASSKTSSTSSRANCFRGTYRTLNGCLRECYHGIKVSYNTSVTAHFNSPHYHLSHVSIAAVRQNHPGTPKRKFIEPLISFNTCQ